MTEHPSDGPAPPGVSPGSVGSRQPQGHPMRMGSGAAVGHPLGTLHLSPSPEAGGCLSAGLDTQSSIVPFPALQAIAWVPCVPPAALPPFPKTQDINPPSCTELLGCVSHHPA